MPVTSPKPSPKIILLTGAPETDSLDWRQDQLLSTFLPSLQRFLGEPAGRNESNAATQVSQLLPRWRHVPLQQQHHHNQHPTTTNSLVTAPDPADATRFWTSQQDFNANPNSASPDHITFLEHSLAVLQDLESSQIEVPKGTTPHLPGDDDTTVTSLTLTSIDGTLSTTDLSLSTDSLATYSSEAPSQQIVTFNGPLTDLKRIPNARHLQSIHPQTMTINLLASVISIQGPRTVRLRRRNNAEMDIIEILLGDETRAGFSVSFWLPPLTDDKPPPSQETLRSLLGKLRSGDVLLATHIALSEFQGNVYGQSLSRRITRNNTTVTVLSDSVLGLSGPVNAKLKRVKEWAWNFVGASKRKRDRDATDGGGGGLPRKRREAMELPPDTP